MACCESFVVIKCPGFRLGFYGNGRTGSYTGSLLQSVGTRCHATLAPRGNYAIPAMQNREAQGDVSRAAILWRLTAKCMTDCANQMISCDTRSRIVAYPKII